MSTYAIRLCVFVSVCMCRRPALLKNARMDCIDIWYVGRSLLDLETIRFWAPSGLFWFYSGTSWFDISSSGRAMVVIFVSS